ncbi:D-alanyl-D-alanine carboxypeptidase [Bacillus luteolus]|uniref:serine-type D-Ala-D-Ala carboxypeptidase n=2 Tax=Litchfieldia luteola TaxID=682179 RepID=A0ABR9QPA3_9BACI|nr:D-alanyl-D-alanine carboxypeptidase [Cytobacillus luteolus]
MTLPTRSLIMVTIIMIMLSFLPQKMSAFGDVSARSAILIEQESGRILYSKDIHTERRIASITKIMTAILAVESGKMKEIVKVSDSAVRTEGSSLYLQPNEKIKLENLVYGLMLRSGNDAAVAIAEHIGGSLEGFAFLMNQKAAEIGMLNTEFANPHGLDDHENHYSTAYDMALLTRYAMNSEEFKRIFGTKVYRAPNPNEKWDRIWKNKNKLLTGLYSYSTGGKTGYTKLANRTLVSTASKDGLDLIAVTIDASDDWNDHIHLFNTGFKNYQLVKLVKNGHIKSINDPFYKDKVKVNRDFSYPLTLSEKRQVKLSLTLIDSKKKGWEDGNEVPSIVGKMIIKMGNEHIGELPLYFEKEVENEKSFWSTIKNLFLIMLGVENYG